MTRALLLLALAMCSLPAHGKTGNFLPMLASLFLAVPALLLAPAIAIAFSSPGATQKRPWVVASLALAVLSFGSLFWVVQAFHLMASTWWPSIYLWTVPGFLLWLAFRHANR
jgi:ABC-type dipeptide/oligopeptide/nickel transport system permease subunit